METKNYVKTIVVGLAMILLALQASAQVIPTITGNPIVYGGATVEVYFTEPGMTGYAWTVSPNGQIASGQGTEAITVEWSNPTIHQWVMVTYDGATQATTLMVIYYPFLPPIDATTIPQFVDPLPHFAAGLRVNAKAGGNLLVKDVLVQQKALSTGTPVVGGLVGDPATPDAGLGNYAAYAISTDNGNTWGPAMWPAQTIEAQQGNQLIVEYRNDLYGVTYSDFNILADQTLMMNGYTTTGNIQTDPYLGDIPMSVHLHGGEMPSNSDGGPTAWFTPGYNELGPGFTHEASNICTYPNMQEGTTLWYHPHDQGLTRINVYTGLAGYYFLRGTNEDALHLPGWSGDGLVREMTPTGKTPTFNGANTYLPEIEIAIQDRMFNTKGELYWPVAPTNPDVNPFWTPEFFGDVMTVNGKSWPYLSVAPRKYMFRMLDGCNSRFLNMWLTVSDPDLGLMDGPPIIVLSTEGGMLSTPVVLDPALGQTLFLAPAERPMVIIDFSGYPAGTTFTLMNDAVGPYPTGDPVIPGLTDRIMQFVVNGELVSPDASVVPANLRPAAPMVQLTDFAGNQNVVPVLTRQILLNEILGPGGPVRVAINNAHFDESTASQGFVTFGGPTETPAEGTTEVWQIINTTADAHPIHPHLVQFQLVSRQALDVAGYMAAYALAWATNQPGVPVYPVGEPYPGGAGSPYPYNTVNTDGAIGGNPAVTPFLIGLPIPALPEEQGWKDAIKSLPGEIETYMVRMAPTDKPINAPPDQMIFPFDPSTGPGFVYHCHIIDHEDMDMMRPMLVQPSPVRFPNITAQPVAATGCTGWPTTFSVTATSVNTISYLWQYSADAGLTWIPLANGAPYSNVNTSVLTINPVQTGLNGYQYRCVLSTVNGNATTNPATLTVFQSPVPTLNGPVTACEGSKWNVYTTEPGMTGYVWTLSPGASIQAGGTPTSNTVTIKWIGPGPQSVAVTYTDVNGCTSLTPTVYNVNVHPYPVPAISGPVSVNLGDPGTYITEAGMTGYLWSTTGPGCTITGGQGTNTVTVSFNAQGNKFVNVTYVDGNGCSPASPASLAVKVKKIKEFTADESLGNTEGVTGRKFEIYPVPNDGRFTTVITSPEEESYTIQVYNMLGVKVHETKDVRVYGTAQTTVDIRPATPGLYSVVFVNNQNQVVKKILITK